LVVGGDGRLPQVFLALPKARLFVGHRYYPGRQQAEAALRKSLAALRELLSV
jgi:hypothetical protein